MLRRWSLGLALSFALHAAVVGGIMGMRIDELKDLPLGAPAAGEQGGRPRARVRAPDSDQKEGTLASRDEHAPPRPGDELSDAEDGSARVSDLRQLGPEGSRFTMLLRLDRLKDTPFAEPVDALLQRMPDRRDLLEGTGLGLYEDFEALLVS